MRGRPTNFTLTASDGDLLARYASAGDERAFAALVERHAGLVLGAAMRRVAERSAAEDIAQAVFLVLAKKARRLTRQAGRHRSLGPWLLRTVRYAAENQRRLDRRRRHHERLAAQEQAMQSSHVAGPDPAEVLAWREIEPQIDD